MGANLLAAEAAADAAHAFDSADDRGSSRRAGVRSSELVRLCPGAMTPPDLAWGASPDGSTERDCAASDGSLESRDCRSLGDLSPHGGEPPADHLQHSRYSRAGRIGWNIWWTSAPDFRRPSQRWTPICWAVRRVSPWVRASPNYHRADGGRGLRPTYVIGTLCSDTE